MTTDGASHSSLAADLCAAFEMPAVCPGDLALQQWVSDVLLCNVNMRSLLLRAQDADVELRVRQPHYVLSAASVELAGSKQVIQLASVSRQRWRSLCRIVRGSSVCGNEMLGQQIGARQSF